MNRKVIRLSGDSPAKFLQGLVTNDLGRLGPDNLVYAALLSPQGKYLADFFVARMDDDVLIDVDAALADDLVRRLTLYKLRSKLSIVLTDMPVSRGTGPAPTGARRDPRHPAMGWRLYGQALGDDGTDWDALRVAHCIPESGIELVPGESFILEAGFDRLNGIDFRKGCYVGQEVTARMQHKTELRKGLGTVQAEGVARVGATIRAGDKDAGRIYTQAGGRGIAYLRFDRAVGDMHADGVAIRWQGVDAV